MWAKGKNHKNIRTVRTSIVENVAKHENYIDTLNDYTKNERHTHTHTQAHTVSHGITIQMHT